MLGAFSKKGVEELLLYTHLLKMLCTEHSILDTEKTWKLLFTNNLLPVGVRDTSEDALHRAFDLAYQENLEVVVYQ
jgi:hypothetical protein